VFAMKNFNKKGDEMWDKLGNWIFVIILLIVLLIVLFFFRDHIFKGVEKIGNLLNFGGG
jgi:glycopeptide antibiotics resistance protein